LAYAILRFGKLKSIGEISSSGRHNDRSRETPNANKSISNDVLHGEPEKSYLESFQEMTKDIKIRKNAVLAIECFMSASPEASFLKNENSLKEWAYESIAWLKKEFGENNIIKSHLHLDESTPHLHTIIIPLKDNKLNCKYYLGGRDKLRKLQTNYHKVVAKYGLDRGLEGSRATHLDIKRFYALLNEALEKEMPDKTFFESQKKYKERLQEEYKKLYAKNLELELKIENYKKQILERPSILEQLQKDQESFNIEQFLERHPGVKKQLIKLMESEIKENYKSNRKIDIYQDDIER
jgi:hypothetical protein